VLNLELILGAYARAVKDASLLTLTFEQRLESDALDEVINEG
jgi:hypothetical protein